MTTLILVLVGGLLYLGWALFSGEHRYITNHLAHNALDKNVADKITNFFNKLP